MLRCISRYGSHRQPLFVLPFFCVYLFVRPFLCTYKTARVLEVTPKRFKKNSVCRALTISM